MQTFRKYVISLWNRSRNERVQLGAVFEVIMKSHLLSFISIKFTPEILARSAYSFTDQTGFAFYHITMPLVIHDNHIIIE